MAWAAARGTALPERAWIDRFGALLPPGAAVLDLGCGAGAPIAQHLLAAGCAVTGVDAAAPMIALCRARFPPAAWPAAAWQVADMRGLDLGRRFAGLLAWDSFFHLAPADQRGMFAVFQRHAAPGAALLFTSGPAEGEAIGEFAGERLYHASLDPAEYRALLAGHGFRELAHAAEDPGCGGRTVWLAQAA